MSTGFLSNQRDKHIRRLAGPHLRDGEDVIVWTRARQPPTGIASFQRSGFLYITASRFLVQWTGRSDGHAEIPWSEISAWGVNREARGGPILAVEADGEVLHVQLPCMTRAAVEDVSDFLQTFTQWAPKVPGEVPEHDRHGTFERTPGDVRVVRSRRTLVEHTRRVLFTVIGVVLVVIGLALLVLPGPGLLLLIPGLALLGAEYDWAQDVLHWVRTKYEETRSRMARRRERRSKDPA